jgi:hypothetical protein
MWKTKMKVIQLGTGLGTFASSQIVLKNFIKISLISEEILIKLAIVPKISKSSWNTGKCVLHKFKTIPTGNYKFIK